MQTCPSAASLQSPFDGYRATPGKGPRQRPYRGGSTAFVYERKDGAPGQSGSIAVALISSIESRAVTLWIRTSEISAW